MAVVCLLWKIFIHATEQPKQAINFREKYADKKSRVSWPSGDISLSGNTAACATSLSLPGNLATKESEGDRIPTYSSCHMHQEINNVKLSKTLTVVNLLFLHSWRVPLSPCLQLLRPWRLDSVSFLEFYKSKSLLSFSAIHFLSNMLQPNPLARMGNNPGAAGQHRLELLYPLVKK